MNKTKKFNSFLESITTIDNADLIEKISSAFFVCTEARKGEGTIDEFLQAAVAEKREIAERNRQTRANMKSQTTKENSLDSLLDDLDLSDEDTKNLKNKLDIISNEGHDYDERIEELETVIKDIEDKLNTSQKAVLNTKLSELKNNKTPDKLNSFIKGTRVLETLFTKLGKKLSSTKDKNDVANVAKGVGQMIGGIGGIVGLAKKMAQNRNKHKKSN